MKIHPVGAELFHADSRTEGQKDKGTDRRTEETDMKNLTVAFRNFAESA